VGIPPKPFTTKAAPPFLTVRFFFLNRNCVMAITIRDKFSRWTDEAGRGVTAIERPHRADTLRLSFIRTTPKTISPARRRGFFFATAEQ
jgi:hypothetical protein